MSWLLLAGAIAAEVTATLCLKAAAVRRALYAVVVTGYVTAFVLLSLALSAGMPLGVAYGVWVAVGVAATALLSRALFSEPLTPTMLAGIAMVMAGVLLIETGASH